MGDWDVEFAQLEELGDKGLLVPSWPYAIRIDGRAFHTFTRGMQQPFDDDLADALEYATRHLIDQVDGAVLAYAQSDEVSIMVRGRTDSNPHWFGSRPMKIATVSASEFTAAFNSAYFNLAGVARGYGGTFDARVVPLPGEQAVYDYLDWRHNDAVRNGVTQVVRQYRSHKQLHGVGLTERIQIIEGHGDRLDGYEPHIHGRVTTRETYVSDVEWVDRRTGERRVAEDVKRHRWVTAPNDFATNWVKIWEGLT